MLVKVEQRGWRITVLPGASALTLATVRAGINGAFFFAGFPPRETAERRRFFQGLGKRAETVVFYETPYRTAKTLEEMKQALPGSEKVFVGIDLSGENERVFRFRLAEAERVAKQIPKGAPVIILDRTREERNA
jgi:16S rRNA (cytidine1402-2'-O)-methyltransferase